MGVFDDDILPDEPSQVQKVIYRAEEPLTVGEILARMLSKPPEWKIEEELKELMEEGVVVKGPPETADGIMGLVEQEPTYQLAEPDQDGPLDDSKKDE